MPLITRAAVSFDAVALEGPRGSVGRIGLATLVALVLPQRWHQPSHLALTKA